MLKELTDKLLKSMKKLTYKINSEEVDSDTAIVNVTVNSVDLGGVFAKVIREYFSYALAQAFSDMEISDKEVWIDNESMILIEKLLLTYYLGLYHNLI